MQSNWLKNTLIFMGFLFSGFTAHAQVYDLTVAKDGSGHFRTVQAAIDSAPVGRATAFRILIKNGKYKEKLTIPATKPFIHLIGESVANTILTFDDYSGKPMPGGGTFGTSNSASVTVNASDFFAANISFENTTGDAPQALAIHVNGDRAAFVNCRFLGGQDTLLANGNTGNRQYYKNCYIDGTVDFIFGSAKAVFDSCVVYGKDRAVSGNSYITAANTQAGIPWGYVFRNCVLPSNRGATNYFLGRPWQNDGTSSPLSNTKVSFLNTKMGSSVLAAGWATWNVNTNTALIAYNESKSLKLDGTAYSTAQRVAWSNQLTDAVAATYILDTIFNNWKPCDVSPLFCSAWSPVIAVTNFKVVKGSAGVPSVFTWNPSWGINGVKYELLRSTDRINFSQTPIYQTTATNDTTIVFGATDTVATPGNSFYYILRASKTGFATHIASDTLEVSSVPTIVSTSALGSFLQGLGTPSKTQTYVFSAVNLTNPLTITPPANFEISNDGGTTWRKTANPITYPTPPNGVLPNTNIMVRLNGTTVGTYSANITHVSTGAATANMPVTGTIQSNPIPVSEPLIHYTFGINSTDTLPERKTGVVPAAIVMQRMAVSNGVAAPTVPAYSPVLGMSYAPSADGLWSTASGAMGGTMNRNYYVEYKVSAGANFRVRVDSMVFHLSYVSTTSSIKLGIVYSTSGFVSDSIDVSGGIGPDGQPLPAATNGGFTTPIIPTQENTATTANYRLALNGSTGVLLQAGQTLTVRTYHTCSSSSAARYVKIKDLYYVGESRNTIKVQEIEPFDIKINPNPAQDVLVLDHADVKGDAQISIYDLTGKKMLSQVSNGVTQTRIDIHSLSNGFYLIECVDSRGGRSALKFVKQ